MKNLGDLIAGVSIEPVNNLLVLISLPEGMLTPSIIFIISFIILNDLIRTAIMVEYTRSVIVHIIINVLTLLPAVVIGAVLIYAGYKHPDRAWFNLLLGVVFYFAWYLGGTLTWLSRKDTEGADVGWMTMGLFITVPCGVISVILF